ncbi:MAG: sensor histidine kinase, partial [Gemmatimonadota bacterium]
MVLSGLRGAVGFLTRVPVGRDERAWKAVAGDGSAVQLEVAVPEGTTVRADADGLRSILRNLLGNAARYSPEDVPVTVSAAREGETVRVEVTDRGPGIPTAHHDRLFERFYRVDEGRSRDEGGTGLGL